MIGICIKCGSWDWDKEVDGNKVRCPKCGHTWEKRTMPLFILTGCSGVGKTTTAQCIQQKKVDFVVLDADIFLWTHGASFRRRLLESGGVNGTAFHEYHAERTTGAMDHGRKFGFVAQGILQAILFGGEVFGINL